MDMLENKKNILNNIFYKDGILFKKSCYTLKKDKEFCKQVLENNSSLFKYFHKDVKNEEDIATFAILKYVKNVLYLDNELLKNRAFVYKMTEELNKDDFLHIDKQYYLSQYFLNDEDYVKHLLKNNYFAFSLLEKINISVDNDFILNLIIINKNNKKSEILLNNLSNKYLSSNIDKILDINPYFINYLPFNHIDRNTFYQSLPYIIPVYYFHRALNFIKKQGNKEDCIYFINQLKNGSSPYKEYWISQFKDQLPKRFLQNDEVKSLLEQFKTFDISTYDEEQFFYSKDENMMYLRHLKQTKNSLLKLNKQNQFIYNFISQNNEHYETFKILGNYSNKSLFFKYVENVNLHSNNNNIDKVSINIIRNSHPILFTKIGTILIYNNYFLIYNKKLDYFTDSLENIVFNKEFASSNQIKKLKELATNHNIIFQTKKQKDMFEQKRLQFYKEYNIKYSNTHRDIFKYFSLNFNFFFMNNFNYYNFDTLTQKIIKQSQIFHFNHRDFILYKNEYVFIIDYQNNILHPVCCGIHNLPIYISTDIEINKYKQYCLSKNINISEKKVLEYFFDDYWNSTVKRSYYINRNNYNIIDF